jgi:hypothetical protein
MARSAARGAVALGRWLFEQVYMWMLCMSMRGTALVERAECAGSRHCFRV